MTGIHLSKRIRTWINAIGTGLWISGVGWMVLHYLYQPHDIAALSNNAEPAWLKVHGAFAFLSIWTAGLLWGMHIVKAWPRHRQRVSGSSLLAAVLALIVSGYLLYYVGFERARAAISLIHQGLGVAVLPAYLAHRLSKKLRDQGPPAYRL